MIVRALLLTAMTLLPPRRAEAQVTVPVDSALVTRIARVETEFFVAWRKAWRDALDSVVPTADFGDQKRDPDAWAYKYLHSRCATQERSVSLSIVRSASNGPAICPWWANWRNDGPSAASVVRVEAPVRATVAGALRVRRDALVKLLDSAFQERPGNPWIVGQNVRFLVDEKDLVGALGVTRKCVASRWWCSSLAGFVHHQTGNLAAADSAFRIATSATQGQARCDWTDIGMLLGDWPGELIDVGFKSLDTKPLVAYKKQSCAKRDSLSSVAFWLGDPFWSDSINERRVEHYARRVAVLLHSAVPLDELYNWEPVLGGDARAELIMRYGWPDRVEWAGKLNDDAAAIEVRLAGGRSFPGTPYLTAEYNKMDPLASVIPKWTALLDPLDAQSRDLEMRPAANYPFSAEFMRMRRVATIAADQAALLRRQSSVLFVYAADLSTLNFRRTASITENRPSGYRDSIEAIVLRSVGPDSIQRFDTQRVGAGAKLVVRGAIPSARAIMGIEIPNEGGIAARKRISIAPPQTLAEMSPGEVAISDPVIVQPPVDDEALPNDPDLALPRMNGTTILARGTKAIGVYWETYGFAPGDTVEISIRVQRYTPQNAAVRAAIALNMRGDRNAPVWVAWTEPAQGYSFFVTDGPVKIVSRSVVLGIESLPVGEYWLDIGMRKKGLAPVIGRRSFVIK